MFSNVVGCEAAALRIGMALRVRFEGVAAGVCLPRFEPEGPVRVDAPEVDR
jgi:hypothetical protein